MSVLRCLQFLNQVAQPFHRETAEGHFTASACIASSDLSQVVLLHHAKLDKWLQPGGHCDGNPNTHSVAWKEAIEETGLSSIAGPMGIFDVDVHWIPLRKSVPGHWHYDIRYLFYFTDQEKTLRKNEESHEITWVPGVDLAQFTQEGSIHRMWTKLREKNFPSR